MKKAKRTAALAVQFTGENNNEDAERQQEHERMIEAGRKMREIVQGGLEVPSADLHGMELSPAGCVRLQPNAIPVPPPPAPMAAAERQRLQQMQGAGAVSLFLPKQEIRPLCDFLRDRHVAAPTEEQDDDQEQQQQNRTLHNSGRALSLQRGGTHERSGSLDMPLPPEDPAAGTISRLDLQAMELVRWFEGRWQYHSGKAGIKTEDRMHVEQYECAPDHVAQILSEAYEPFEPCMLGNMCCGASRLSHPQVRRHYSVPERADRPSLVRF
jgi:hypothetical protein